MGLIGSRQIGGGRKCYFPLPDFRVPESFFYGENLQKGGGVMYICVDIEKQVAMKIEKACRTEWFVLCMGFGRERGENLWCSAYNPAIPPLMRLQ